MESTWASFAPRVGKRWLLLGARVSAVWILSVCLALPIAVIDLSWPSTPQTAEAVKLPPRGSVSYGGSTEQLLALEGAEPENESTERGKGKARHRRRRPAVQLYLRKLFKGQTIANQRRWKRLASEICDWHVFERHSFGAPSKLLIFLTTAGQEQSAGCCGMRSRRNQSVEIDPPLSTQAEDDALDLNGELLKMVQDVQKCEKRKNGTRHPSFCIDAFVSSPLTAAIQTASKATAIVGKDIACKDPHYSETTRTRVTWLLSPLVRERVEGLADVGTELQELLKRLTRFFETVQLERTVVDTGAMAPEQPWWYTNSETQLRDALERTRELFSDTPSSESGEEAAAGVTAEPHEGDAGLAAGSSASSIVAIGYPDILPPSKGSKALKTALDMAEALLLSSVDSGTSTEMPPRESEEEALLRGKILLQSLCKAEQLSTALITTHERFLKVLSRHSTVGSATIKVAMLTCGPVPTLHFLEGLQDISGRGRSNSSSSEDSQESGQSEWS